MDKGASPYFIPKTAPPTKEGVEALRADFNERHMEMKHRIDPDEPLVKLIEPNEILDMAKRHDQLPDARGITLTDSNILDFTDELLNLFVLRMADALFQHKVKR